ncbi:hypothetical protein C0J52_14775 [Blattella germanica]|nr:hypothetical protein C0J52_14775 [Blattella germanica]
MRGHLKWISNIAYTVTSWASIGDMTYDIIVAQVLSLILMVLSPLVFARVRREVPEVDGLPTLSIKLSA